jgi:DNA-binding winged helix-turn-helix (wHTH) protein/WD40 repeat protein
VLHMAEVNSSAGIVRFGVFEADLQTGELRKNGLKVPLQDQPFQVCAILLENSGKLVTREELRLRVWPEDTFVDFDHALNTAITKIRMALGDEADNPRFVETLPRRGYRFVAPVDKPGPQAPIPSGPAIEAAPEGGKTSFFHPWMAIAFLSAATIAVLVWVLWRHPSRTTEVLERRLTANSLDNGVTSAAVSPDGKFLAYSDYTGLYLKEIRTGETHRVTLPQNFSAEVDDWFPDGSHLLVHHDDQPANKVCGVFPSLEARPASLQMMVRQGRSLRMERTSPFTAVALVRKSGSCVRTEQIRSRSQLPSLPGWEVPRGLRMAIESHTSETLRRTTRASSVELNEWRKANAQTFFSDNRVGPSLHWLRDGRLVYVMGDEIDHHGASLWTVSLPPSGKPAESPKRIARGVGWIWQLSASHDGKVLTFLRENSVSSAYIGTLAPDGKQLLAHRRLTLDENENDPFAWTPDGKAVLFSSDRNGTSAIFKQATDQPLAEG